MIELKHVSKSFQDTPALAQVTAQIQDGLIFGLVGSNGAGKSTLLRLVSGILKPEEGGDHAGYDPCVRAFRGKETDLLFVRYSHLFSQCHTGIHGKLLPACLSGI